MTDIVVNQGGSYIDTYFANGYVGADAIIGFIYLLAVTWIQQGICFEHIQDYLISIIPNWMEEEMNTFFANMQLE